MNIRKMFTTAALLGVVSLTIAVPALAGTSSAKDCTVCQFKPAIPHTESSSTSTTTTKSHTHISKTLRAQVTQYEKVKHIRVAINGGGKMSDAGCTDPTKVKRWDFHDNQAFYNADRIHRELPDTWDHGWKVCTWKIVKNWHGHKGTFVVGKKMNCSNTPIGIPIKGTPKPRVKTKVFEITLKTFRSDYDKVFTKTTTTTSKGGTTTTYSCESGWTLTSERGSPECKYCPPTPCPTPTPPAKAHGYLSKVALKDGANVALSGGEFTYSISLNGSSSGTTTNAASGSSRDLGQFNGGDSVTVCETNPGGYTPDQVCISHTFMAGESYTFPFVNRKTTPPPPVASPPSVSVNFVQEIDASTGTVTYTARVCGAVKSQSGHTLSVSFRANYGHFDSPNLPPMTANGSDQQVCNTYTSPTEAGVKDQITIVVLDTTTGLNASNVSNLFDIVVAPANPS